MIVKVPSGKTNWCAQIPRLWCVLARPPQRQAMSPDGASRSQICVAMWPSAEPARFTGCADLSSGRKIQTNPRAEVPGG